MADVGTHFPPHVGGSADLVTLPLRATATAREQELVTDYSAYAFSLARGISWPGATLDDVRQEALLGVLAAVRTYRPDGGMSLKNLIALAVRRQLWTAIKTARRGKHGPLNDSLRVVVDDDGDLVSVLESIADRNSDMHNELIARLELRDLFQKRIPKLSDLEQRALVGFAGGLTYAELGAITGTCAKSIDNALQRARTKLAEQIAA